MSAVPGSQSGTGGAGRKLPGASVASMDGRVPACPPLALCPATEAVAAVARQMASDLGDVMTYRDEGPQEVSLPPMEGWPRTFLDGGPLYVLGQLNPLVIPLGALAENERANLGVGLEAIFGYTLPLSNALALGLEGQFELSMHKNPSADVGANLTRVGAAARARFNFDRALRPFGVAGGGMYWMAFDSVSPDYHLSGLGIFFGGGVDYVRTDRLTIRAEATLHLWDAAENLSGNGGMAVMLSLGGGAAFTF